MSIAEEIDGLEGGRYMSHSQTRQCVCVCVCIWIYKLDQALWLLRKSVRAYAPVYSLCMIEPTSWFQPVQFLRTYLSLHEETQYIHTCIWILVLLFPKVGFEDTRHHCDMNMTMLVYMRTSRHVDAKCVQHWWWRPTYPTSSCETPEGGGCAKDGGARVNSSSTESLDLMGSRVKGVLPNFSSLHCNTQQHTATHCNTLQHTATHCTNCNALQHIAAHCNLLQHTATHCNTLLMMMIIFITTLGEIV